MPPEPWPCLCRWPSSRLADRAHRPSRAAPAVHAHVRAHALAPFAIALGCDSAQRPNAGTLNIIHPALSLDITRGPLNIYTMWGMVFVSGILAIPSMWLLLLGLFRRLRSTSGGGSLSQWRKSVAGAQTRHRAADAAGHPGGGGLFQHYFHRSLRSAAGHWHYGGNSVLSTKIYLLTSRAEEGVSLRRGGDFSGSCLWPASS